MDYRKKAKEARVEAENLLKTAQDESRAFTDEESTKYDGLLAQAESLTNMADRADKAAADRSTPVNTPDVSNVRVTANPPKWKNNGEFLDAVRLAAAPDRQVDNRLLDIKNQSGMNEGVGSEGGFLVETDHSKELLKRTYELGALSSRIRRIPVSGNANGLTINAVAETNRATGSRWGGVQAYWTPEAGQKVPSFPTFRKIELKLKKLIGLCYATDELLQDTSALEGIISQAFAEEFSWMIDNAIMRGNAVGQPQGILNSGAVVVVPAEAGQLAATVVYQNIVNMWARMWARSRQNAVWFINQDIEPQLHTMSLAVGVGGVPVYLPAGGASAAPYSTLFGRPVIPIEQCSTLGQVGDIVLADLSQYLGIDKGGTQSASSIHVRFVWDESVFRFVYRMDGASMWNAPLTPANGANAQSPFITLAAR